MFTAFTTALAALNAHGTAVDVVGNNLANLNTTGFKASAVAFHDLVSQSIGAGFGETQVGFGVGRPTTLRQFTQGAIQASSGALDSAIQGDGFFVVKDKAGAQLFTRAGHFQVDAAGYLVTATGERVQGWREINGAVDATGVPGDLTIPVGTIREPLRSRNFSFDMNLNANAVEGDKFSTSIDVYDSLGAAHMVKLELTRTANANEWDYALSFPDSDVTSPITPVTGTLTFGPDGRLTSPAADDDMPQITIAGLKNEAADLELTWGIFSAATARITQFVQPSSVSANAQDGAPAAQLLRVGIADAGKVVAQYSNGQQRIVGQLAMAAVRNPESLVGVGNNAFSTSARTALPAIGVSGTGGRGSIVGGAIEFSTVDIAREFTNLIVLQRGYQANTRIVTTVDELSQETINLKR